MCARRGLCGAAKGQWTAGRSAGARLSDRLTHHKQLRLDKSVTQGGNVRESTAGATDGADSADGAGTGVWVGVVGVRAAKDGASGRASADRIDVLFRIPATLNAPHRILTGG